MTSLPLQQLPPQLPSLLHFHKGTNLNWHIIFVFNVQGVASIFHVSLAIHDAEEIEREVRAFDWRFVIDVSRDRCDLWG